MTAGVVDVLLYQQDITPGQEPKQGQEHDDYSPPTGTRTDSSHHFTSTLVRCPPNEQSTIVYHL